MTITNVLSVLTPAILATVVLLSVLYRRIYRVGDRSAEQVLPSLWPLEAMGVKELFSPAAERHLRATLTDDGFRRAQQHRMVLALEYVRRISHNALVLQQWAAYETSNAETAGDSQRRHLSMDLIAVSVSCRIYCSLIALRLHCWLSATSLLPFQDLPSFEGLIRFGHADLSARYAELRRSAGKFSRFHDRMDRKQLVQSL
ncbi:MAG TPA: hypothetical protein VJV96_11365 [Candidatus Angelobacter sp.]|nr:hypothetical protein [Candidatus Angelobacter sp.]